jgi:hypothetical protein
MANPGRTLLACWLAVVLTGTVVGHRHAAAPSHSHGFGWAVLPSRSAPDGLSLDHRHFVLLGVELGPVSGPTDGGDSTAGAGPAAGQLVPVEDIGCDAPDVADFPLVPRALQAAGLEPIPTAVATCSTLNSCPLVSHARSGVLRS